MTYRIILRLILVIVFAGIAALIFSRANEAQSSPAEATKRCEISFPLPNPSDLAYLASHLNVGQSPIEGWKLPIVSATRIVDR